MILSIITINRNNASGLRKTMQSVLEQSVNDIEYIVIDGASTDSSTDIIQELEPQYNGRFKWISEPDDGIYNAINKGIQIASGEYVQFLNSGDNFVDATVLFKMISSLEEKHYPSILYGNMLKVFNNGRMLKDRCFAGQDISLLGFYTGTLNHSPAIIRRNLFDKYGLYDESLNIVSDWKWYLKAIILGGEKPVYTDIDVTQFDMYGISETNEDLSKTERRKVLEELIPEGILIDYDNFASPLDQIKRLKRHPMAYKTVWFIERCLFKLEKTQTKHRNITQYR